MDERAPYLRPTRDHVIPKSRGGRSIVIACHACNQLKGAMCLDAWIEVMRQVPEWWKLAEKRGPRGRELHNAMIECGFKMPSIYDFRRDFLSGLSPAQNGTKT
jgi:hypothetical protein